MTFDRPVPYRTGRFFAYKGRAVRNLTGKVDGMTIMRPLFVQNLLYKNEIFCII